MIKNDPPDYTGLLDKVMLTIVRAIAQKRDQLPKHNRNAIIAFYSRLNYLSNFFFFFFGTAKVITLIYQT